MTFSLGSTPRSLVKYNDKSIAAITEVGSGAGLQDAMVLIKTITASSSDLVTFDSDIDSTYPIYLFKYINVHPSTNSYLTVGFRDGSTAYDATKTTTDFYAQHAEADGSTALAYSTGQDLAQSTSFQRIGNGIGNGNDESGAGTLHLFAPSSSVFVKHFISNVHTYNEANLAVNCFCAGYFNTTSAIDEIQFKMSSGNIDAGTIKLYGVT